MNQYTSILNKSKLSASCFSMFLFLSIMFISCEPSPRKDKVIAEKIKKPPSSYTDTITIQFPAAVFYNPDSVQLEKIKSITDLMVYDGTMHEYFYQLQNAHIVLEKYYPRIKIYDVNNARYLLFNKADGEKEYIDLNTKDDACGMFVFDGYKPSRLLDMTNVESELGFYFTR